MPGIKNPNHPKKGSSIKVEPIRSRKAIARIKKSLLPTPRNHCLFVLGINTAYRMNELLSLTVGQVEYLMPGDLLDLKQSKTSEYRATMLNKTAYCALAGWLSEHPDNRPDAPLFISKKTRRALTVNACWDLVKRWCAEMELRGNFGSHTLRKTWGYHQRVTYEQPLALLTKAYGHSSERETLRYLGILPSEIAELYSNEI